MTTNNSTALHHQAVDNDEPISNAPLREELGDFCNIACLKAIITGLEEILGEPLIRTNLILAGRLRGKAIVNDLQLKNSNKPLAEWSAQIAKAIGKDGTRLCTIAKIEQDGDSYWVYLSETVCSAGEAQGSERKLSFTQGAIQGAIEEVTGRKLAGTQMGSVLRGQDYDIIKFHDR